MTSTWGPSTSSSLSNDEASLLELLIPSEFVGSRGQFLRVCDFTSSSSSKRADESNESFKVIDTARVATVASGSRRAPIQLGTRGGRQPQQQPIRDPKSGRLMSQQQPKGKAVVKQPWWQTQAAPMNRDWSITPKSEYELIREIPLVQLGRLNLDASLVKSEDIVWCGELRDYDKSYERIFAKSGGKDLSRSAIDNNLSFYNPTSLQDHILEQLAERTAAALENSEISRSTVVACTDKVLAALMNAHRSVNSWDVVVTRMGNTIFLDKRDGSPLEYQTVNECAFEPPTDEPANQEPVTLANTARRLATEATLINQAFSQHILSGPTETLTHPNPFAEEGEKVATGAYRYRKFVLPGKATGVDRDLVFVVRGEVNAKQVESNGDKKFVALRALNEYLPNAGNSWRNRLDMQRGGILATEIKNNSFKFGRWVAEAAISGCESIKLGYVSRKRADATNSHSILNVQNLKTAEISTQIGFSLGAGWAAVNALVELVLSLPEESSTGRYLIVRDPKKSALRLYAVPWEEFASLEAAEEEEDDYQEDEENQDLRPEDDE